MSEKCVLSVETFENTARLSLFPCISSDPDNSRSGASLRRMQDLSGQQFDSVTLRKRRSLFYAIILAVGLILTLVMAFQAHMRQQKKERTHSTAQVNDFDRWTVLVPQFLNQHRNYTSDSFPNPPVTLLAFAPLMKLSPPDAQFAWVCCKFLFCLIIFASLLNLIRQSGVLLSEYAILLILWVWLWPVLGDMQEGQTNLLMLAPLAAGLWTVQGRRLWQTQLGGVLIALAVCIKVTPIIFLIYFAWKREWRVTTGILLGLVLWLLIVPGLAFGWNQNLLWLGQWVHIMILPYVRGGHVQYFVGQSVPSFLSRLIRHVPAFHYHAPGSPAWRHQYINLLSLPANVSDWLIRIFLMIIGICGLGWAAKKLPMLKSRRYALEIGAVATFELWASPRTWVPHFVTLAMALFAVAMVMSDPLMTAKLRRRAAVTLAMAGFLMFMTTDVGKIFGHNGHRWLLTFGVSLWGAVLLMWTIFTAAGRLPEISPAPGTDVKGMNQP